MGKLVLENLIEQAREIVERNNQVIAFASIDSVDDEIKVNCRKDIEQFNQIAQWLEELKSYKDLEEQGLFVRLPCKLNGTLYSINYSNKTIVENIVIKIYMNDHVKRFNCIDDNLRERIFFSYRIGETVFLTREEAEKKLKEMKNDGSKK